MEWRRPIRGLDRDVLEFMEGKENISDKIAPMKSYYERMGDTVYLVIEDDTDSIDQHKAVKSLENMEERFTELYEKFLKQFKR